MQKKYDKYIKEMFSLGRFGIKLGLSVINNILINLDNPHKAYKSIHIAGTNGKGSIASTISSILTESGIKTGLYTSPHLVRFNERFCINGNPVADEDIVEAYEKIKDAGKNHDRQATFFEISTAMAFYLFKKHQVDFAIIETGMGGRLDATNIIIPEVSIITNISIEHSEYLGNTIREITGEKAGIIKQNRPVITGVKQKDAQSVLTETAKKHNSDLYVLGKDFKVRRNQDGSFNYYGLNYTFRNLTCALLGNYQIQNAAIAISALEIISEKTDLLKSDTGAETLTQDLVQSGLTKTSWPGRLEIVSQAPFVMIDGAHNLHAAKILADYLKTNFKKNEMTLILGILDDKPYKQILSTLIPCCSNVILTEPRIARSIPAETLQKEALKYLEHVTIMKSVDQAVSQTIKHAESRDKICIAGSLYVAGEAKQNKDIIRLSQ